MKAVFIFLLGLLIFGLTMFAWIWLNALGCGMNPTGCKHFTIAWTDWEALQFFIPTFALGAGLMVWGVMLRRRSK